MSDVIRFGVSVESELLENFDELIEKRGYITRSEALRDLMRDALVRSRLEAKPSAAVIGSLTLIYDHHASDLAKQMAERQHDHHNLVISVLHVHVSHDDCMEVIALRGAARDVRSLADALLALKGVKHGELFITFPTHNAVNAHKHSTKKHHAHDQSGRSARRVV